MTDKTLSNKPPAAWRLLMKLQNPFMKWLLRSPLHCPVSRMYMLITFTGRKSGTIYTTPVQYAQDGDKLYVVTSEGYVWWKNLRGGADVQVHLRGEPYAGIADVSKSPELITHLVERVYPKLSEERRTAFVPGKIAITIRLTGDLEHKQ